VAVNKAMSLGHNLLVVDVDAILIKNPNILLEAYREMDIVASRDHGPPVLPLSNHWGTGRLCTGFIYFRHSSAVQEIVNTTLARCKVYGHDQISFNNVLSRAALSWDEPANKVANNSHSHSGFIPWLHQHDPDFEAVHEGSKEMQSWQAHRDTAIDLLEHKTGVNNPTTTAGAKAAVKLSVLMLDRHTALRYCNKPIERASNKVSTPHFLHGLKVTELTPDQLSRLTVVHCYLDLGPLGESGELKREGKVNTMLAFNLWGIYENITDHAALLRFLRLSNLTDGETGYLPSNLLQPNLPGTQRMLRRVADPEKMHRLKRVWIDGDANAQHNYLHLTEPDSNRSRSNERRRRKRKEKAKKKS